VLLEIDVIEDDPGAGANHVHAQWRDPVRDFGVDLIDEHVARDHDGPDRDDPGPATPAPAVTAPDVPEHRAPPRGTPASY
jgi:hypothetical protein